MEEESVPSSLPEAEVHAQTATEPGIVLPGFGEVFVVPNPEHGDRLVQRVHVDPGDGSSFLVQFRDVEVLVDDDGFIPVRRSNLCWPNRGSNIHTRITGRRRC